MALMHLYEPPTLLGCAPGHMTVVVMILRVNLWREQGRPDWHEREMWPPHRHHPLVGILICPFFLSQQQLHVLEG